MKKIREIKSRLKAKANNIFGSDSEPTSTPTSAHDPRETTSPPFDHASSHSTHQNTELAGLIAHSASVPTLGAPGAAPETASPETSMLGGALISSILSTSQPNLAIEAETLPSQQISPLPLPDLVQSQLAVVPASQMSDPDTIIALANKTELVSPHSAPTADKVPTSQSGISSWVKSEGWANLKGCLITLNQAVSLSGLGPLKTVIEGMADCIGIYEAEAQGRQAYIDLREELERIFKRMQKYLDLSPTVSANISDVCRMIEQEIEYVKNRQSRTRNRRLAEAEQDDNVLACYRHICDRLHDLSLDMTISTLATVEQHAMNDQMKQLAPAISARYNSGIAHTLKRGPCTEGTRTKVLDDMHRWVADRNAGNIYWISGMAGTGKTTIAYSLCKWLDTESSATLGGSFFCSRSVPECRNIGKIIPSIAYQLAQHFQPFRYALYEKLRSSPDALDGPPALQFESFIVELLTHPKVKEALPKGTVVVIDALDECEDTTSTQQILDALSTKSRGLPVKFVISSRPEAAIRDQMEKNGTWTDSRVVLHELDTGEVQTDIRKYLEVELAPITPSESVIEKLVERAGVLFIYAATVIRYVGRDNFKGNPRARLQTILNSSSKQSKAQTKDIDELYRTILEAAMNNDELEAIEREDIKMILSTVVCAKTPLTVDALGGLLDLGDVERVKAALRPLWSVLHVMGQDMMVTTLHASFSDYLTDPSRSGNSEWHCNDTVHHHILAQRCFECIRDIRPHFNICRLESSYLKDDEVEDLDLRIQKYIPDELRYACQYWSAHMVASNSSEALALLLLLENLLAKHLLLWMEVLNLTKNIATSAYSLTISKEWVARHSTSRELVDLIQDAWRFAFTVASSPISESTPHIYVSMLPFLASDSPIRKHYTPRMNGIIHVEGTALDQRKPLLARWSLEYSNYATFSPDGTLLVMLPYLRDHLHVVDTSNGQLFCDLSRTDGPSYSFIAISPDNNRVACVSGLNIWVHDVASRTHILGPVVVDQNACSIIFSHDGSHLISGSESGSIYIWDAYSGKPALSPLVQHRSRVLSLAVSSDGTRLISGSNDCTICVWDMQNRYLMLGPISGHTDRVVAVAISPNNRLIVSGSADCTVRVWDSLTGHALFEPFSHETRVRSVAISPDSTFIMAGLLHRIQIWDATTGKAVSAPLSENGYVVKMLRYSSDGTRIISYSRSGFGTFGGGILSLFDAQIATNRTQVLSGHTEPIWSIDISPNGKHIVSGSHDKTVFVWDIVEGQPILGPLTGHDNSVTFVKYSQDGHRFLSCSWDEYVLQWDAQTGDLIESTNPIVQLSTQNMTRPDPIQYLTRLFSAAYSPNNSYIATISNNACVWNSVSGEMVLGPIYAHAEGTLVEFSSDGMVLITGWDDGTIENWDVDTGQLLFSNVPLGYTTRVSALAFSSDHSYIVLADLIDGGIRIQCMGATRNKMQSPKRFEEYTAYTSSVQFSHDDTRIVSGSDDGIVDIWDAQLRTSIFGPLQGHTKPVNSVAFSPNDTYVASASGDCTIRIWGITTQSDISLSTEWFMNQDGWVTDEQSQRLIWVPPKLRSSLISPRNTMVLSCDGYVRLNFDGALIGDEWAGCWLDNFLC